MFQLIAMAAASIVTTIVARGLYSDTGIRETEYSQPLANIPGNAAALIKEMMGAAAKESGVTPEQLASIEGAIYSMMSEGAVQQRNHEMVKTREKISYAGQFLSWFMKDKGLTYQQLKAKYQTEFTASDLNGHMAVIQSASRSNQSLNSKLYNALVKSVIGSQYSANLGVVKSA